MIPDGLQGILGLGLVESDKFRSASLLSTISDQKKITNMSTVVCRSELESMFYVENPALRIMILKSISDVSRLNETNQFGYELDITRWPLLPTRISLGSSVIYQPSAVATFKVSLQPDSLDLDLPEILFNRVSSIILNTCTKPDTNLRCTQDPSASNCVCLPSDNIQRFYSEIPALNIHIQSDIISISSKHLLRRAANSPNCLCLALKSIKATSPSVPTTPNPPGPLPTTEQETIKIGLSLLSDQSWVFSSNRNTWTAVQAGCERDVVSRDVIYVGNSEAWIMWLVAVFVGLVLAGLITWVCVQAAGSVRRELPNVQVGRDDADTDDEGAPDQSAMENVAINTSSRQPSRELERTTGLFSQISKSGLQVGSPTSKSPVMTKRRIFVNKKSEVELKSSVDLKPN